MNIQKIVLFFIFTNFVMVGAPCMEKNTAHDFLGKLRDGLTQSGIVNSLQQGADVNQKDGSGWTCLHEVIKNNSKDAVIKLIEAGANVNAQTSTQWTPVHEAALQGNIEIFTLLINAYGCVFLKDKQGKNACMIAQENHHQELILFIQKLMKNKNAYAFLRAYKAKAYKSFEHLLDCSGIDVNRCDTHLMTVLHYAAAQNNMWVAIKLIQKKEHTLRLDLRDSNGWTPVTWARFKGHTSMINLIADAGYEQKEPTIFSMKSDPTSCNNK